MAMPVSQLDHTVASWDWGSHPVWTPLNLCSPHFRGSPRPLRYFLQRQSWGPGVFQSRADVKHIVEILTDLVRSVSMQAMGAEQHHRVLDVLARGSADCADRVTPEWNAPRWFDFKRAYVLWALYAMEHGIVLHKDVLQKVRTDARGLSSLHAQLQVVAAVDGYKNDGTPWRLESDGLWATMDALQSGVWPRKNSTGLGHSEDEEPYPHMHSTTCLYCGRDKPTKMCQTCCMARYCDESCRGLDWPLHTHVCSEHLLHILPRDFDEEECTPDLPYHDESLDY